MTDRPCAVYRHFSETGRLLYVGQSIDPSRRWEALQATEQWAYLAARRTDHWLGNVAEARLVERIAIRTENPLFNVQGRRGSSRSGPFRKESLELPDGSSLPCWYSRRFGWTIGHEAIARRRREAEEDQLALLRWLKLQAS